jgi:hypothetical protein
MLDPLFVRQGVVARLRRSPRGPPLAPFATALHHTGDTTRSIQRFLCAAEKCAQWLHEHGYSVYELDEDLLRADLSGLTRHRGGSLPQAAQGLGHLVRFLRHRGGTHLRQDGLVIPPLAEW